MGVAIGGGDDFIGDVFVGFGEFGELAADEAFGGEDGIACVGDGLAFGGLADETFACFGEGDDGGGGASAFGVFEDEWFGSLHDGHAGVGGAEVDAENLAHKFGELRGLVLRHESARGVPRGVCGV